MNSSKNPDKQTDNNVGGAVGPNKPYAQTSGMKGPLILRSSTTDSMITNFGSLDSIEKVDIAVSSSHLQAQSNSVHSVESLKGNDSVDSESERRRTIRFRDEGEDGEAPGEDAIAKGLVDVAYFDTLMKAKHPWEDPNYFPGFSDLFMADQMWIADISMFPCRVNSTYEIEDKDGKPLFYVEKVQDTWSTWGKSICLRPIARARNGFIITILSKAQTLLAKFVRKTHCYADQMDIVEAFYGREESYIGRIERSRLGFVIRDQNQEDIYRLIKSLPDRDESCFFRRRRELRIFRTDNKEVVGRAAYWKKACLLGCFKSCSQVQKFGILCNPDLGTNAKILFIGAMFLQLHFKEEYVDLPLGNDCRHWDTLTAEPALVRRPSETSEISLDLLLSPFNYSAESLDTY